MEGVKRYTADIVGEMLASQVDYQSEQELMNEAAPTCPKCKKEKLKMFVANNKNKKGTKQTSRMYCTKDCGFVLWGNFFDTKLAATEMVSLIENGSTEVKLKSKDGKKYTATLLLDSDFKVIQQKNKKDNEK
jgi:hypothetical protein